MKIKRIIHNKLKNNLKLLILCVIPSVTSHRSTFLTIDIIASIRKIYLVDIATPPAFSLNASVGRLLRKLGFLKIHTINVRDAHGRRSHSAEWAMPNLLLESYNTK